MRAIIHALGRNLAAGLRLALFLPVGRASFRISVTQLLLVVALSAAIDIDADWVRAAHEARFSLLGLHGEIFALGLLALASSIWRCRSSCSRRFRSCRSSTCCRTCRARRTG
jgi:hypothetical protein